jgi:hypothetical protein
MMQMVKCHPPDLLVVIQYRREGPAEAPIRAVDHRLTPPRARHVREILMLKPALAVKEPRIPALSAKSRGEDQLGGCRQCRAEHADHRRPPVGDRSRPEVRKAWSARAWQEGAVVEDGSRKSSRPNHSEM